MRVELRKVVRRFNEKMAIDIDALTLESGKIYAFLGPNGSGKTTILKIVAGLDKDYTGDVIYNGEGKIDTSCIAYMPQSTYMFDFSVLKNVLLGIGNNSIKSRGEEIRDNDIKNSEHMDNVNLGNINCNREKWYIKNRAEQALINVGMGGFSNVKAQSLSGGEAQRVALARTLVLGRSLVLLDEPASATDLSGVELVENYIKAVNKEDQATIVFTTHSPSHAAHIADEVIMMYSGKVLEKGSPHKFFEAPQYQETRDFLRNWRI